MEDFLIVTPEKIGLLMWIVWGLIGVVGALLTQRITQFRQMLAFNIVLGIAGGILGGFLSVQVIGDTPMMLVIVSVLGAIFGAGIILWIAAALTSHFSKR